MWGIAEFILLEMEILKITTDHSYVAELVKMGQSNQKKPIVILRKI